MKNYLLSFLAGVVVGGIAGWIIRDRKERAIQESLDTMNDLIEKEGYARRSDDKDEELKEPPKEEEETKANLEEIKEKLVRGHEAMTNYHKMYNREETEESGVPTIRVEIEENEEEEDEDMEGVRIDWDAVNFHESHKGKKPKIISRKTFETLPDFLQRIDLKYYRYSGDLVNEEGEVLLYEEEQALIGDSMTKYGFTENDEEIIYVLSYDTNSIFIIEKVEGTYEEFP